MGKKDSPRRCEEREEGKRFEKGKGEKIHREDAKNAKEEKGLKRAKEKRFTATPKTGTMRSEGGEEE